MERSPEVPGGTVARSGEPTNVALANSWIVINRGGGPTDDKPAVTLETPRDLDRVSSFLNDLGTLGLGCPALGRMISAYDALLR